jgi:tetratricopeptide (TPR) repeat protein
MLAISVRHLVLLFGLFVSQTDPFTEGVAHFERGEYAKAETSLQQAVTAHSDPRAIAFLALARAMDGKCENAIPDLQAQFATIADDKLRRLLGLSLAQCELSSNRYDDASIVLERLRGFYPADEDVLYETARMHMQAWNEVLREMFLKTPRSYRVNQLSGEIFDAQGRYAEAVEQYQAAIAKNPKALGLHFEAGRALIMSSHTSEAIRQAKEYFEAELGLNPRDAVAEYEIAEILVTQEQNDEAMHHLERAVQLNSQFPEALIALAKLKLLAKADHEGISLLERAVELMPNSEAARYSLMMAYRNAGRFKDAIREEEELNKLQKPPEGEFSDFLKKLGQGAPAR